MLCAEFSRGHPYTATQTQAQTSFGPSFDEASFGPCTVALGSIFISISTCLYLDVFSYLYLYLFGASGCTTGGAAGLYGHLACSALSCAGAPGRLTV